MKMESAIDRYLHCLQLEKGLSSHSISAYAGDLAKGVVFFKTQGLQAWRELSETLFIQFIQFLGKTNASTTLARRLVAWRGFLTYLARAESWPHRPWELVQSPKLPARLPHFLSLNDIEAIIASPNTATPLGCRDRALLELLYASGLRVSELVGLQFSQ